MSRILRPLAWLITIPALVLGMTYLFVDNETQAQTPKITFSLTSHSLDQVDHSQFYGKWLLLTFGFTSCADVCPIQTQKLAFTSKKIEAAVGEGHIAPVFVSVDYVRDTAKIAEEFAEQYDANIIGLAGTPKQLDQITQALDTYYEVQELAEDDPTLKDNPHAHHGGGNIQVIHSSQLFIVNPYGRLVAQFAPNYDPNDVAKYIKSNI